MFEIHLFIVQEYEEDDGEFLKLEETKGKDGFFDEDYKVMWHLARTKSKAYLSLEDAMTN